MRHRSIRHRSAVAALVAATTLAAPLAAQSVVLSGHATDPGFGGAFTFSAVLPQAPVPSTSVAGWYFTVPATLDVRAGGGGTTLLSGAFDFYAGGAHCGGFDFYVGATNYANVCGPVLFTGPVSAPVFTPGAFTGFTTAPTTTPLATVQDVTIVTTPEPVSAALLATGLLGAAAVGRRRRHAPDA